MSGFISGVLFGKSALRKVLQKHFGSRSAGDIATAAREFPVTSRVDVQTALEQIFAGQSGTTLLGVHSQMGHETPTLAQLFTQGPFQMELGPLQHDDVDVGDELPVRCLKNGLWLSRRGGLPFAVLLGPSMRHGVVGGVHVEVAVPIGEAGAAYTHEFFRDLELRVSAGKTYRGRVLSLENQYKLFRPRRRRQRASAAQGRARRGGSAAEHAGAPRAQRREFRGEPDRHQGPSVLREEGTAVLRPAGNRQNPHDSLSGFAVDGSHDAARHSGAPVFCGRVHFASRGFCSRRSW